MPRRPYRPALSPDLPSRRALAAWEAHLRAGSRRRAPVAPAAPATPRSLEPWVLGALALAGLAALASMEPEPCPCHSPEEATENASKP